MVFLPVMAVLIPRAPNGIAGKDIDKMTMDKVVGKMVGGNGMTGDKGTVKNLTQSRNRDKVHGTEDTNGTLGANKNMGRMRVKVNGMGDTKGNIGNMSGTPNMMPRNQAVQTNHLHMMIVLMKENPAAPMVMMGVGVGPLAQPLMGGLVFRRMIGISNAG
eukprot:s1111_g4.t1